MEIITTLTILLVSASAVLLLFNQLNHPAVPAYIIAGLIIGGFIDTNSILELAQLGIAFLIFIFGLKFDPKRLYKEFDTGKNTTTIQVLGVGLISYVIGIFIGFNSFESAVFAVAGALSSSMVGLQLGEDEIQLELLHGRLSETIHMIQDFIGIFVLAVIFSTTVENAVYSLGLTILLLGSALFIREYLFDKLAAFIDFESELMMLSGLTMLVGFIAVADFAGLPMVIGSFAAGLTAAKFPHNMELIDTLGSIKDFFSAIFFVSLGALVTFPTVQGLTAATALVLITGVLTPWIVYRSLKLQGYDARTAMLTGLTLDQVSEIALVLTITAFITNLISDSVFQAIIIASVFTMVISSYTKKYEERIYQRFRPGKRNVTPLNVSDHVLLIGHHIQGKRLLEKIREEGVKVVVIDNDPEKVDELKEQGVEAVYGDVMDMETWREANYTESQLVISTVPSRKVSEHILELDEPKDKIVRADSPWEASKHMDNGAIHVIVPDIASSELLIDHIEGILHNENYKEELRRKSLLEIRDYLNS